MNASNVVTNPIVLLHTKVIGGMVSSCSYPLLAGPASFRDFGDFWDILYGMRSRPHDPSFPLPDIHSGLEVIELAREQSLLPT